jgi:hypothetical protein
MWNTSLNNKGRSARRVLPGTGRLGVVGAYFDISAALGAMATAAMFVAVLWPNAGWGVTPATHPWLTVAGTAVFTWGAFQTSRMLQLRQRSGGWAAGITFVGGLAATVSPGGIATLAGLGLAVAGLGLLASVWRYLD